MDYNRSNSGDLDATKNDGTTVANVAATGCTLGPGTYYFSLGTTHAAVPSETALASAHLKWSAALAATITLETSNFPAKIGAMPGGIGADDVTNHNETAGNWIQENPSTAIVAVSGASNTSTAATVTAGGAAAGGCMFQLGNLGSRRARIKVVVTVGGVVRCSVHGKLGS